VVDVDVVDVVDVVLVDEVVVVLDGGGGGEVQVGSPMGGVPSFPLLIAHVTVTVPAGAYCTTTRSSAGTPRLLLPILSSMLAVSRS
jgi:hypothetical protein